MRSRPPTSQRTRSGHGGAARCAPPGRARPPDRGTSERHGPPRCDYLKARPAWHEKVAHREAQPFKPPAGYVGETGRADRLAADGVKARHPPWVSYSPAGAGAERLRGTSLESQARSVARVSPGCRAELG